MGGDPNLKLFPYYFWNLGVQHAFTNNVSLDVSYVGSHSSDIFETYYTTLRHARRYRRQCGAGEGGFSMPHTRGSRR